MSKYTVLYNKITSTGVPRFFVANMLYSLSTALISFLAPSLLQSNVFEDFIYLFQMVLFLTGIFTLGLIPGLLRYYKFDNHKYDFYYYITALVILFFVLGVGFFPDNFISKALKIVPDSIAESLVIYSSVIFSLLFLFNRGKQIVILDYNAILKDVVAIVLIRVAMLLLVHCMHLSDPYIILLLLCVAPFLHELLVFVVAIFKIHVSRLDKYWEFLGFIFKISIAGVIFTATSRLFIISTKSYDLSLAAALSFAAGMTGIITIFNTTFSSVFIGRLDHRNAEGIVVYLHKIKKYLLPFLLLTLLLGSGVFLFVTLIYPDNTAQAAIISSLTVVHCAMMAYLGLITLMTKTYNLLNVQILLNGAGFLIIFLFVKYLSVSLNEYISYIIINSILLIMEAVLAFLVLRHIRKYNSKMGERV